MTIRRIRTAGENLLERQSEDGLIRSEDPIVDNRRSLTHHVFEVLYEPVDVPLPQLPNTLDGFLFFRSTPEHPQTSSAAVLTILSVDGSERLSDREVGHGSSLIMPMSCSSRTRCRSGRLSRFLEVLPWQGLAHLMTKGGHEHSIVRKLMPVTQKLIGFFSVDIEPLTTPHGTLMWLRV